MGSKMNGAVQVAGPNRTLSERRTSREPAEKLTAHRPPILLRHENVVYSPSGESLEKARGEKIGEPEQTTPSRRIRPSAPDARHRGSDHHRHRGRHCVCHPV